VGTLQQHLHYTLEHYGIESQRTKAVEEMAELILELVRGAPSLHALASEIADVENVLDQIKLAYGIRPDVDMARIEKMQRTVILIAVAKAHAGQSNT
jgi:hypothetical protein